MAIIEKSIMAEIKDKLRVLSSLARILNQKQITWAVGASVMLYLRGVTDHFNDIDLLIDEKDVATLTEEFTKIGTLIKPNINDQYQSKYFLEFVVDEVEVDVIAGFVINYHGIAYDCPLKPSQIDKKCMVNEQEIPLHALSVWRKYYRLMERASKVEMIDQYVKNYPLGLKQGTVSLLSHQDEWVCSAACVIEQLWQLLKGIALDIEHVGSTSISSISAKPIIDLAVKLKDFDKLESIIIAMQEAGYLYRGSDIEGQCLFVLGSDEEHTRSHHIHFVLETEEAWENYLNFKDYLNTHEDKAKVYDDLKRKLATQFANDRIEYTNGKEELIKQILQEAIMWRLSMEGDRNAITNNEGTKEFKY